MNAPARLTANVAHGHEPAGAASSPATQVRVTAPTMPPAKIAASSRRSYVGRRGSWLWTDGGRLAVSLALWRRRGLVTAGRGNEHPGSFGTGEADEASQHPGPRPREAEPGR